jgi:hypothetical protein
LEIPAALGRTVSTTHCVFEIPDVGVCLSKPRKTFFQYDVALEFVEFVEHDRFRKMKTDSRVDFAHRFFCVAMADAWPGANAIENDLAASPIFSEYMGLSLASGGEFVVIRLEKRSLCVANQKNASHASPKKTATALPKDSR